MKERMKITQNGDLELRSKNNTH